MNKFFLIRTPFPHVKLTELEPGDESLVIIHDDHISDKIFFDRQLSEPSYQSALLYFDEISQLVKTYALLVPRNNKVVHSVNLKSLDPLGDI